MQKAELFHTGARPSLGYLPDNVLVIVCLIMTDS